MGGIGGNAVGVKHPVAGSWRRAYIRWMRHHLLALFAALAVLAWSPLGTAAGAAELTRSSTNLSFETVVAGLTVMITDADVELDARGYRVDIATRTAGAYRVLFRGETRTLAQGLWAGDLVAPLRYAVDGIWRGTPRRTLIDYTAGQPAILRLDPANDAEREPVPLPLQRETIDTISAAALLARRATTTGRCDGAARTFDGRRLFEVESRTVGWEALPSDTISAIAGPALRCDFEGRVLAGFLLNSDRDSAARPQQGTAWFARLTPDAPMLPVRMRFTIRWIGSATMTLTGIRPDGPPLVRQRADADATPLRQ